MTHSSRLDRQAVESLQLAQLQQLLQAILDSNAFYSRKLATAGVMAPIGAILEFQDKVPFTTKEDIVEDQLQTPPYGTNLTYPLERYVRLSQTSGTTREPIRWLDTPESWDWMVDNWKLVFQKAGLATQDRVFFAFSFAPFLGFWTAFDAAVRLGCLCIPAGGLSSSARLSTMMDNGATVLCCTPTYAVRLAEVAAKEQVALRDGQVRLVIVAGEPGGSIPSTRARIEALWPKARVADHHGMTEIGPVTYECPKRPTVLHVIESAFIPEVVHPRGGTAVERGEVGELVLTNLGRTGSPLLRYRTGDLVKTSLLQPCECGSWEMALEGGILGRADDMVMVRGVNIYPSALESIVRSFADVSEYRVEIHARKTLPELILQVEPSKDCRDPAQLAEQLEAAMQSAFALRVPVAICPSGTLPRFEMKAKRWVRI
jgi:phenylacetate-CoA ligase